jgi:hypothetical protein
MTRIGYLSIDSRNRSCRAGKTFLHSDKEGVMHSQQLSSTVQAQTILHAFSSGELHSFASELERTARVHCEFADQAEQERWELLSQIAGELRTRPHAAVLTSNDACWSLLKHLAGTKAPRIAVATA